MPVRLPFIVGFGGYNAAGRSSGYQSYYRTIYESLSKGQQAQTIQSLASMMKIDSSLSLDEIERQVLDGTLVRRIDKSLFDVNSAAVSKKVDLPYDEGRPITFELSARELPKPLPEGWQAEPLDEEGRRYRVALQSSQRVRIDAESEMAVQAAGFLPTGFDPASYYRSNNHPRGLQLAVLGASDAVASLGFSWKAVLDRVAPNDVAVYSSSVMSQLDGTGFGGMMSARSRSARVTSKQLPLGLNTMPADFINAYVLGNVGSTGGITGACATFLYNLRQGVEDIRSGRKHVVIAGASEAPVLPEVIDGYAAMSALGTDAEIARLDGTSKANHRRASRPFGENCGFTIAESTQYVVLMSDELAFELGANIYGMVPDVFVNADGFKKSISAPGAGNYITMAHAAGVAQKLLGEDAVKHRSFVQAHGSSTPQNRVTESKIFHEVAKAFGIESWPVAAVKAYVGHSLGPASGDQMISSLGVFEHGILPGIKTIDKIADDVYADHLAISNCDQDLGDRNDVAFLNSKGFGGNNATAAVFSPKIAMQFLEGRRSTAEMNAYKDRLESTKVAISDFHCAADKGDIAAIYEFGNNLIDESDIRITPEEIHIPGYDRAIALQDTSGIESL